MQIEKRKLLKRILLVLSLVLFAAFLILIIRASLISKAFIDSLDDNKYAKKWVLYIEPSPTTMISMGSYPTIEQCKFAAETKMQEMGLNIQNTKYTCGTNCILKWEAGGPSDCPIQYQCHQNKCKSLRSQQSSLHTSPTAYLQ